MGIVNSKITMLCDCTCVNPDCKGPDIYLQSVGFNKRVDRMPCQFCDKHRSLRILRVKRIEVDDE